VADAARQMVHGRDRIEPNADAHAEYRFYVDQYIATYGRLQDLIQETTRHVARRAR
jgi:sugar (pentulose or hexulose) kinase